MEIVWNLGVLYCGYNEMQIIATFFLFFLFCIPLLLANHKIDSFLNLIAETTIDTVKVDLPNEVAWE